MLPIKAYVVEAYYKWIVDSGYTPYIAVDTTVDYIDVPVEYIQDDQMVLNIAPKAIRDLVFHCSYISFRTQFSGVTYSIYLPILSVLSIFAQENSEGKIFHAEDEDHSHPAMKPIPRSHIDADSDGVSNGSDSKKSTPFLQVLK